MQKVTSSNKLSLSPSEKNLSCSGTDALSKASFISSKPYSSFIFSRVSSSSFFGFTKFSFKISSASVPEIFAKPSPSSSFGRSGIS